MMGRQMGDQASLFYAFRLEDRVPKDHLLRRINVFVAALLGSVRRQLKPYYSEIGRPSIDPDLMVRMLDPRAGETVYDPACGTGGMLLKTLQQVRESGGDERLMLGHLFGQEKNLTTAAIARMNLFLRTCRRRVHGSRPG